MNKLTPRRFPFLDNYVMPHGYEIRKRKRKLADEENFHIVALGDNVRLADGDIFTSILGMGLEALSGLFGANRKKLNQSDWLQIMPVSGYWNNALRSYLSLHIGYDTDLGNIPTFTQYFVHENLYAISDGKYANLDSTLPSGVFGTYLQKFYSLLSSERQSAGYSGGYIDTSSVTGKSSTSSLSLFSGQSELSTILIVGAGLGLVFALINKKKR